MALEYMLQEMLNELRRANATEGQIRDYRDSWNSALQNRGEPLPCPRCFLAGVLGRLKPISEKNDWATEVCQSCRATFQHPSPG